MEFFRNTNINFLGKRQLFKYVSLSLIVIGIVGTILVGIPFGIDFTGGTEVAIQFSEPISIDDLRSAIEQTEYKGSEIKSYGTENQYLVRIQTFGETEKISNAILDAVAKQFPNVEASILKSDVIGPRIGKELRTDALFALLLAIIAILLYVSLRFEFSFALGAVLALVHDIIIAFTWTVLASHLGLISFEVNQSTIAAILTVLGFSINDTVVIFDRIRENREIHRGMSLVELINMSINQTLSRTINTSLTTFLVLFVLVLLGGPVLQGFAFIMFLGIIVGTYSSIYVASALTIWYISRQKRQKRTATAPAS